MSSTCSNVNALTKRVLSLLERTVRAVLAVQRSLFPLHLLEEVFLVGKKKKVRWVVHRSAQIDGKDTWLSVNDMFTSPLASSLFSAAEKLNFASKS